MSPTFRIFLALVFLGALCAWEVSTAQVSSTRVTPYDYQTLDADGNRLGDHNRFDTALAACLNSPRCVYIQGGRYRITKPTAPPPPPPAGTATLNWTPSTQPTGITVASYRINYGTSATALVNVQNVANVTTATVSGLAAGSHFFCVKTVSTDGQESACSAVVSKTVT